MTPPSVLRAYEELQVRGWQYAAADAWSCWALGQQYTQPRGIDRYTAALIEAANWEIESENRTANSVRAS